MNRLDLPNRCLAEIAAEQSDGTAYTDACCRPLGHAHGHMSLAVDDRKDAARKARKTGLAARMDDFDWHKVEIATPDAS